VAEASIEKKILEMERTRDYARQGIQHILLINSFYFSHSNGKNSVLGIRDMSVRIRILGPVSLTNGSGSNSRSDSFLQ
jgi:hypothetical protein